MIRVERKVEQPKEEKPTVQQLVKQIMKEQHVTQVDMAEQLGLSQGSVATRLSKDMRVSSLEQILDILGYDIVLKKRE